MTGHRRTVLTHRAIPLNTLKGEFMVSDILIIVLIILFAILGFRRGLARTLLNFAAMIASTVIANFLSDALAQAIYNSFIKQGVIEKIQTTISTQGVDTAINTSLNSAPDWVTGLLNPFMKMFGMSLNDVQKSLVISNDQTLTVAQNLEKPVGALTISIISLILMAVIFTVVFCLFKLLIRHVVKIFEIPVVSQINHILGGIIGFAEGIVFVVFAVNMLYVVFVNANPSVVNNSGVFGSLFNLLCFFK